MNRVIILIALLTCSFFTDINAQTYTIKGTVTSEGEELPYVHVMLKGTNLGVVTDESGFYQMSGVPGGSHVVEAQAVGYKKESVPVQID
jgi:outer membrane receptor for ferrienterochelin and colicins